MKAIGAVILLWVVVTAGLSALVRQARDQVHVAPAIRHTYRVSIGNPSTVDIYEVQGSSVYTSKGCTVIEDENARLVASACGQHTVVKVR